MKRVHLIGIGGSGLSAIARLLMESGYTVSGSDQTLSPAAIELANAGVRVAEGHSAHNVEGVDLVIRSSAITDDNIEVQAARAAGTPVLKRAEFLENLTRDKTVIAVAGTHGKTTTTAMTAWALTQLGMDPSYIIGGILKNLGNNAHSGKGKWFVIEADEYDQMFIGLKPDWMIVTNVEHDHPDCYPSVEEYHNAFTRFVSQLKPGGALLACLDDPGASAMLEALPQGCRAVTYGLDARADYSAIAAGGQNRASPTQFEIVHHPPESEPVILTTICLQLPGRHNLSNALAVTALMHLLGMPPNKVAEALASFSGTVRRFELRGESNGVTIIDDYAHHPTEIKATLSAARSRYAGRRIWAVWQPHTFSRTQALLEDFCAAFDDADQVLVTEIYPAREKPGSFSASQVVERMAHPAVRFTPTLAETSRHLLQHVQPGDVVLVLSAGDADRIGGEVLQGLEKQATREGRQA